MSPSPSCPAPTAPWCGEGSPGGQPLPQRGLLQPSQTPVLAFGGHPVLCCLPLAVWGWVMGRLTREWGESICGPLIASGHLEHPGHFVGALRVLPGELAGAWGPPALPLSPSSPHLWGQPPVLRLPELQTDLGRRGGGWACGAGPLSGGGPRRWPWGRRRWGRSVCVCLRARVVRHVSARERVSVRVCGLCLRACVFT